MWQRRSEIGAYMCGTRTTVSLFGPEGILSDEIIDTLASVGPIICLAELEWVVSLQWVWFGQYGNSLLDALLVLGSPVPRLKKNKRFDSRL